MKISAKVPLKLNKSLFSLTIEYNAYDKPSFDEYLCCAISLFEKNSDKQNQYIDEITGDGSLNSHFKQILKNTNRLSKSDLEKSLNENLYPDLKIKEINNIRYFSDLKKIIINNKIYDVDIEKIKKDWIKDIFNIKDIIDFHFEFIENDNEVDMYDVEIKEKDIYISLNNQDIYIDKEIFNKSLVKEEIDIKKYKGTISNKLEEGDYIYLNSDSFNELVEKDRLSFFLDGNKFTIKRDKMIQWKVFDIYEMYFYMQKILGYCIENQYYIIEAAKYIIKENLFSEISSNIPLLIVKNVDEANSLIFTNYFLEKKYSEELSRWALNLIKNNDISKNKKFKWSNESLKRIKNICHDSDFNYIYRINDNLEFTEVELSKIDDSILSKEHKDIKEKYLSNLKNIKKEMNEMMGEISNSGIREEIKKIKSNNDTKNFSSKYNKLGAHNKKDIDSMTEAKLKQRHNEIKELYNIYKKIKTLLEKNKK